MVDRVPDPGPERPPAVPPGAAAPSAAQVQARPATVTATAAPVAPARSHARDAWRASLREFFTIVAGVLAALGAQAFWEGRQERELERS